MLWQFAFWSSQPSRSNDALTFLEFLNVDCSSNNVRWAADTANFVKHKLYSVSQLLDLPQTLEFKLEPCIHCKTVVEPDHKLQLCFFISYSLTIFSFNRTAMNAACNPSHGTHICLIGAYLHFPITMLSLQSSLLVESVGMSQHTSCLQLHQEAYEVPLLYFAVLKYLRSTFVSAIIGSCFIQLINSHSSPGSTSFSQC